MHSSVLWSNLSVSEQTLDERLANILATEKRKKSYQKHFIIFVSHIQVLLK